MTINVDRSRTSFTGALFGAILLLGIPAASPGQQPDFPSGVADSSVNAAIERFAATLAQDVEQDGVGGITAAVFRGSDLIWAAGFGQADVEHGESATVETIYRTGSISKTFTAVLLMVLVDSGVVQLDDRVIEYLPEFSGLQGPGHQIRSITLRQLASHTAGLVREPELDNAAAGPIAHWKVKVLASIPTTSLRTAPGEHYSYSNIGFGILGLTLSRAAGRPFMDLVDELIFRPLGMATSTFIITADLEPRLAVGYANRSDGTIDAAGPAREHAGRGYKVPNGGVYSTVGDLARFGAGLTGASTVGLLSQQSREEMQRVQTPGGSSSQYGLGLSVRSGDDGLLLLGHGGSVAGYTAHMLFEPASKLGVVLLFGITVAARPT
jgi:CubicO group peptidase (beta-lactamase class C family)